MTAPLVRLARPGDLDQLGVIGPAAYAEAYAHLWDRPDAYARHLESFGQAAFAALLAQPSARVWVAEAADRVVGFLLLRLNAADPVHAAEDGVALKRVYILGPARGLGLGRRLLDAALADAHARGAAYIWLDVMAKSTAVQKTYRRWGFRKVGGLTFEGGTREGHRDMVVMRRAVEDRRRRVGFQPAPRNSRGQDKAGGTPTLRTAPSPPC